MRLTAQHADLLPMCEGHIALVLHTINRTLNKTLLQLHVHRTHTNTYHSIEPFEALGQRSQTLLFPPER
jgi:hypothetical protein